jgi:23S rRNA pseudouridine1911/1915/1917 synthase
MSATAKTATPSVDMGVDVHLDEHGKPRMVERRFVVEEPFHGYRLDHYLKKKIPRLSRTKLQKIIKTHLEGPNGRSMKPHSPVATGDELVIRSPARPEPPCPRTFGVLYEDEHMMVIDKPAGLPVHASARYYFNTLTRVLWERFPDQAVQICHRLDRETSGALVVARTREVAKVIKIGFQDKVHTKTYLAIVHGTPEWETFDIDQPLGLIEDEEAAISIRMVVRDHALPSLTKVRVVERVGDVTLVACQPVTGRQHQIRAHLAAIGFPIVGDKLYTHGDEAFIAFCDGGMTSELLERFQLPRHALHAASIELPHPITGDVLSVEAPLPPDLREFMKTRVQAQ